MSPTENHSSYLELRIILRHTVPIISGINSMKNPTKETSVMFLGTNTNMLYRLVPPRSGKKINSVFHGI